MNLSDVGKTIAKYGAPLLGAVVGGPLGATLGHLVASKFGADQDSPEDIINKIQGNPDAAIKLSEIQSNERIRLQELAIQMAELSLSSETKKEEIAQRDRDSARNMRVNTISDYTPRNLAYLIVVGFLFSIAGLFLDDSIATEIKEPLLLMLGFLGSKCSSIIDFYFGSSSRENNNAISKQ